MDLKDLETFVQVAETGSFTKAGQVLGVPTSTVSRRVSRLEQELRMSLVTRNGRFFKLTQLGQLVAKRSLPAIRELEEISKSLLDQEDVPRGTVSVTMSTEMGGSQELANLLKDFRREYPEVLIAVEVTNRFVDLIEENIDVALRIHSDSLPPRSSLMMKRLLDMTAGLYASPNYLERHPPPDHPDELVDYDCVSGTNKVMHKVWSLYKGGTKRQVEVNPVMLCNEFQLMRLAIIAEMGIGALPDFLVQKDLAEGRLVQILPDWTLLSGQISLVWPTTKHLAPRVRAFLDFMGKNFAKKMKI